MKKYIHHSGRPGGIRIEPFNKIQKNHPKKIILNAVKGMLPKCAFGRKIFKNLKVFKGNSHIHHAQTPKLLNL